MDDQARKESIAFAEKMVSECTSPELDFWKGYLVAMKVRGNHTPEGHSVWLSYFGSDNINRHSMGIGYRLGYSGGHYEHGIRISSGLQEAFESRKNAKQQHDEQKKYGCIGAIVFYSLVAIGVYFLTKLIF